MELDRSAERGVPGVGGGPRAEAAVRAAGRGAAAWEVDVLALAKGIADDPLSRPAMAVVMGGGLALGFEVIVRAPAEAEAVAAVAEAAIAKAARRVGTYPATVRVRFPELVDPLGRLLSDREVEVEGVEELPEVEDLAREGGEKVGLGPEGLIFSAPESWSAWGLPDDVVAELFRVSADFWRAEPWKVVENLDLIDVEFEDGEEALAVVLGHAGEEFGLALYSDYESFAAHVFAPDPLMGFLALRRPMLALNFERRGELPRRMVKEIARKGWEVASPAAYPMVMAFSTLAGGITRERARRLTDVLVAVPAFVERHRSAFVDGLEEGAVVEWRDPDSGTRLAYTGLLAPPGPLPVTEPPELLGTALPEGAGADPAAALERADDPDRFRAEELPVVDRFRDWLERQGLSEQTIQKHVINVETFVDFLTWHMGIPVRAVTEFDLRSFLYDWYPRKIRDARTRAESVPASLKRFFEFLAKEESISCPWAGDVLRQKDAFLERLHSFPGGFFWDEAVAEWQGEAIMDLLEHVLLPDTDMAEGGEWGAMLGPVEATLLGELQRRWLLWRDEVIRDGERGPVEVFDLLQARQREWETAPHAAHGGRTPVEVIREEREQRERRDE